MRLIGWRGARAAGVIVLALCAGPALAHQVGPVGEALHQVAQRPVGELAGDAADEVVKAASERYAVAAYADALAMLDAAKAGDSDAAARSSIERYRALCLLALGRQSEAEQAIERLLRVNPRYDLDRLDVSPSTRVVFQAVRRRVLPALAREEYASGKAAFDRKSYAEATAHLQQALALASEAADSGDPAIEDVRTLGQGFLDLTTAALAESAKPAPASQPTVAPGRPPTIVDPVPLRHPIPAFPPQLRQMASGREGVVELTVDESGRVATAVMRKSINGVYDDLLLEAVKAWRYRPGTVDGKPVRRTVTVVVRPD